MPRLKFEVDLDQFMQKLCVFLMTGLPLVLWGIPDTIHQRVADSTAWHRLMHYRRSLPFGKLKSEVDGEGFFFSKEGKTNPLAELVASVSAFSQDIRVGKLKLHPQCAFPARFEFLKKELNLKIPEVACPELNEIMQATNPESVTLVFSSAYPNNPASMFGHTFLRINRKLKKGEKRAELLDYGVSFAATVGPEENPLAFIALGLTGGYRGQFSWMPYYVKVNEYNNAESRDVWEYDLNLSPKEARFLLAHVWEIETNSYFDYYFFDENCSYQMLTVIEAAKPEWELSNFSVSVIPSETIKKLKSVSGAISEIRYRPSHRKRMVDKTERLNSEQKTALKQVLEFKLSPKSIADPFVLDAAVAQLFYEKNEREGELEIQKKELQAGLLIQRSKLGKTETPTQLYQENNRPDLGHFASRFSFSPGYFTSVRGSRFFQEFGVKSAYHDLLNKDLGFQTFSQIDFPQIYLRYFPNDQSLQLDSLELLHITSLFPLSFIEKRASWKLQLAYQNPRALSCLDCKSILLRGGPGATVEFGEGRHVLYGLLLGHFEAGGPYSRGYRLGPELELAAVFNPFENYKSRLAVNFLASLFQNKALLFNTQLNWEHALSLSQSWEFRFKWGVFLNESERLENAYQETKFSVNYYF